MKFNRLFFLALLGAVIPVQSELANKVTNKTDIGGMGEMNITTHEPIEKYLKPQQFIGIASVTLATLKAIGTSVASFCATNPVICAEWSWRVFDYLTPTSDEPAPLTPKSGANSVGCPVWTFALGVCFLVVLRRL